MLEKFTWWLLEWRGLKFGFTHDLVWAAEKKYLERWVLWFGAGTLRLHRFWSGDDQRAPHDHPWWFITFPLRGYWEKVYWPGRATYIRFVKPWRFHYRPANFRHIVLPPMKDERTAWTVVITGGRTRKWGFWPEQNSFIPYNEWR